MLDARNLIGTHDALFITLDTLRYDVARDALANGRTPNLAALLPGGAWEERHSPGNFTYAAHHAFFAGFLPTPIPPGAHPRLFAARFEGSETTAPKLSRTRGSRALCRRTSSAQCWMTGQRTCADI